jgi:ribosomal-protein-alanine N-acetyltransferase
VSLSLHRDAVREIPDLVTGSLHLVAITAEMLRADERGDRATLETLIDASLTTEWPPVDWEPHVFGFIFRQFEISPHTLGWHRYMVLHERFGMKRTLVGSIGAFPKHFGEVEMGYSTLPGYQRRGFATAAGRELVRFLFTQEGVRSVSAQTYTHLPESVKVMERCGLTYDGDGDEPHSIRYRLKKES